MPLTRREVLAGLTAAAACSVLPNASAQPSSGPKSGLGIATASYGIRSRVARRRGEAFTDPLDFLAFARERGAGGIQVPIPARGKEFLSRLRSEAESAGMFLESSQGVPRDKSDVERFDAQVRATREAGSETVRTVLLAGRRYETFSTTEEWRQANERWWQSLTLAEPIMARHKVYLGVENHKDFRCEELVDLIKRISSEFVGVTIDTGNNISLLEDPTTTVEALAPYAVCVHLKDMAVKEYEDGFLLSEMPYGEGFLNLKQIVATVRKARPKAHFFTEMLTRDPLKVPVLTDKYWATMDKVPARSLADMLSLVRARQSKELPQISNLSETEQLKVEDDNVRKCVAYAAEQLGI